MSLSANTLSPARNFCTMQQFSGIQVWNTTCLVRCAFRLTALDDSRLGKRQRMASNIAWPFPGEQAESVKISGEERTHRSS